MTVRLELLAVAATSAHRSVAFPGDEPIDAQGRKALQALILPRYEKVVASPMQSAVQTAAALGLCCEAEPLLRDCDFGRWAGQRFVEVQAAEPAALAAWLRDPAAAPHGGESFVGVIDRARAFLEAQLSASGSILAVTHPAFIRAAIVSALGADAHAFSRIDVAPLTRLRLSSDGRRWTLSALLPHKAWL